MRLLVVVEREFGEEYFVVEESGETINAFRFKNAVGDFDLLQWTRWQLKKMSLRHKKKT